MSEHSGLSEKAQASLQLFKELFPSNPMQRTLRPEDFITVALLLCNYKHRQHTVTKHVIEATQRAPGTIRRLFREYQDYGWVRCTQKIGRSEIYEPTPALLALVNAWGEEAWNKIHKKREAPPSGRVSEPLGEEPPLTSGRGAPPQKGEPLGEEPLTPPQKEDIVGVWLNTSAKTPNCRL